MYSAMLQVTACNSAETRVSCNTKATVETTTALGDYEAGFFPTGCDEFDIPKLCNDWSHGWLSEFRGNRGRRSSRCMACNTFDCPGST
jgi:hypothetical protein